MKEITETERCMLIGLKNVFINLNQQTQQHITAVCDIIGEDPQNPNHAQDFVYCDEVDFDELYRRDVIRVKR